MAHEGTGSRKRVSTGQLLRRESERRGEKRDIQDIQEVPE